MVRGAGRSGIPSSGCPHHGRTRDPLHVEIRQVSRTNHTMSGTFGKPAGNRPYAPAGCWWPCDAARSGAAASSVRLRRPRFSGNAWLAGRAWLLHGRRGAASVAGAGVSSALAAWRHSGGRAWARDEFPHEPPDLRARRLCRAGRKAPRRRRARIFSMRIASWLAFLPAFFFRSAFFFSFGIACSVARSSYCTMYMQFPSAPRAGVSARPGARPAPVMSPVSRSRRRSGRLQRLDRQDRRQMPRDLVPVSPSSKLAKTDPLFVPK